ncbi:hypothetical protein M9458_013783, partial [Cirrhinus mrigala]
MSSAHVLQALCLLMVFSTVNAQDGYTYDTSEEWVNTWRQGFNFQCPHGATSVRRKARTACGTLSARGVPTTGENLTNAGGTISAEPGWNGMSV